MAITSGFNMQAINFMLAKVDKNYDRFYECANSITAKYIDQIATAWFSPEAKDYFENSFAPKMNEIYENAYVAYSNIYAEINYAGHMWAEVTGNSGYIRDQQFTHDKAHCDVSAIKSQTDDGAKGIDSQKVVELNSNLEEIFENACEIIRNMEDTITGEEFLGGEQIESLRSKLSNVKGKLTNFLASAKSDINIKVESTIEEYGVLTAETANKLSGVAGVAVGAQALGLLLNEKLAGTIYNQTPVEKRLNSIDKRDSNTKSSDGEKVGIPTSRKVFAKAGIEAAKKAFEEASAGTIYNQTPVEKRLNSIDKRDMQ